MSQPQGRLALSSTATTFKSRRENFLRPTGDTSRLALYARGLEDKYRQVHHTFFGPSSTSSRLQCLNALTSMSNHTYGRIPQQDEAWRIQFMARCCLLEATFYHSGRSLTLLEHWRTLARCEAVLLQHRFSFFGRSRRNDAVRSLNEVEYVCHEMHRRILNEGLRERWVQRERMNDDTVCEWVGRISDTWLAVTDR